MINNYKIKLMINFYIILYFKKLRRPTYISETVQITFCACVTFLSITQFSYFELWTSNLCILFRNLKFDNNAIIAHHFFNFLKFECKVCLVYTYTICKYLFSFPYWVCNYVAIYDKCTLKNNGIIFNLPIWFYK